MEDKDLTVQNISEDIIASIMPVRRVTDHKGKCGRIAIIAGSVSMIGAAILTARAALRSGVGIVYLMTVPEAAPLVNTAYPEIIVLPLSSHFGAVSDESNREIVKLIKDHDLSCLAIGPGMGRKKYTFNFINTVIKACAKEGFPIIVDADGLNALSMRELQDFPDKQMILTPHPGEFKRLFGLMPDFSTETRVTAAVTASQNTRQLVVLKGHRTIVAFNDKVMINTTGNPGMASAGVGDVLAGLITGFLGQGLSLFDAAAAGVYIHGAAGDLVFEKKGYGLIATDIIEAIPEILVKFQVK
ncbi:NAD(P)H-hydrate dehydratase [Thermoproteota archaeon]